MKQHIHPDYHSVVFRDSSTGEEFLTRSTATSATSVDLAGERYPLIVADVTSASHPFWTGNARVVDSQGQVQKFLRRFGHRVRP